MEKRERLSENQHIIPNGLVGIIFLISTEVMFFSGLISGFVVNHSEKPGAWDAPWQNVLPVDQTLFNTVLLLASAVTMTLSTYFSYKTAVLKKTKISLWITILLGAAFVALQGREWISLIAYGLTTSSSIYGAFFYIIIGAHGLHVIAGLLILLYIQIKISRDTVAQKDKSFSILVGSVYWYFVVFLWPVLYYLIYQY